MTELQQVENGLAKLIEDMSGSIQAEIHTEVGEVHAEVAALEAKMDAGFDRVEAATRRNTSTLAGGGRNRGAEPVGSPAGHDRSKAR